jgi:PAS domain-containing protein
MGHMATKFSLMCINSLSLANADEVDNVKEPEVQPGECLLREWADVMMVRMWATDAELTLVWCRAGAGLPPVLPLAGAPGALGTAVDRAQSDHPAVVAHLRALAGERVTWYGSAGGRPYLASVGPRPKDTGTVGMAVGLNDPAAARQSPDWYPYLFDQSTLPMARLDLIGRILDANAAFGQLIGRPVSALRGRWAGGLLASGNRYGHAQRWAAMLSQRGGRYTDTVLVVRGDRRLVYARATGWLARCGSEEPTQVICSLWPVAKAPESRWLQAPSLPPLPAAEARLLEGIAEGLSNAALGRRLFLSRQGLDYRLSCLRDRLQARSRSALVARAYALGLIHPGLWPPRVDPGAVHPAACVPPRRSAPADGREPPVH